MWGRTREDCRWVVPVSRLLQAQCTAAPRCMSWEMGQPGFFKTISIFHVPENDYHASIYNLWKINSCENFLLVVLSSNLFAVATEVYWSKPKAQHAERFEVPMFTLQNELHLIAKCDANRPAPWTPLSIIKMASLRVRAQSEVFSSNVSTYIIGEFRFSLDPRPLFLNATRPARMHGYQKKQITRKHEIPTERNAYPDSLFKSIKFDFVEIDGVWSSISNLTARYLARCISDVICPTPAKYSR